jgi:hypothetical protein
VFKAIVVPIAFLAVMGWSMGAVGGFTNSPIAEQQATVSGSALGWAFMNALNASLGTYCTLAVNVADFTRYAKSPRSQYVQMIIIPVLFVLVSFLGIATTSASKVLYGEYLWNPADIFAQWGNRAAVFFASAGFAISIIGTNISANSISAAVDLMSLCPKYINLRRGQILASLIGGWVFVPWNILASAIAFLDFMSGYTVPSPPATNPDLARPHNLNNDRGILDNKKTKRQCPGTLPSAWNVQILARYKLARSPRVMRRFCAGSPGTDQFHHPLHLYFGRSPEFICVELYILV